MLKERLSLSYLCRSCTWVERLQYLRRVLRHQHPAVHLKMQQMN
jgi:hypothetical protein